MRYILPFSFILTPFLVSAQQPRDFADLVDIFLDIINNALIPGIFAITFLVIIWGLVQTWILNPGDENAKERGRQLVFAGIIALVVMSGIWGILAILRAGFFG